MTVAGLFILVQMLNINLNHTIKQLHRTKIAIFCQMIDL